jgi:hypothetical protein
MGGVSTGHLCREDFDGRTSNVLRGKVSLRNNGGFIQMATNLAHDAKDSRLVDASSFDGIEVDVQYQGEQEEETFNIQYVRSDRSFFVNIPISSRLSMAALISPA